MKYESGKNNINAMFGVINYSNQSSLTLDEVYEKLKTPYQEYYKAFDKCQKYVNDINSSDEFNTKIMLFDYSMLSAMKMVNPKNLEYINLEYLKNKCRENSLQDKASHIISYIDNSVSGMGILNEPYKNGGAIMSDESYGKKAYIIGISRDFSQNYEINLFGQNELVKNTI